MPEMTGLIALGAYRTDIDAGLRRFFTSVPALLGTEISHYGQDALERLEEYCLRPGKRLRGALAALAYDSSAGTDREPIGIELGVILELLQGYLLIVDDVMDRSLLRRGEATVHESYRAGGIEPHTADMLAVNVGLLSQHLASLHLMTLDVPPAILVKVSAIMQRNIALTGFGQLDDIALPLGAIVSEAEILRKYILKSSYYTFVNPLQLGLALADKAYQGHLQACEGFGIAAGIAFQIHDDWLGIFGDAHALGKSNLDDIHEGKFTTLVRYALEYAKPAEVESLRGILGNPQAGQTDLETVRKILTESGAKQHSEQLVKTYTSDAKRALEAEPVGSAALSRQLMELLDYAVGRES